VRRKVFTERVLNSGVPVGGLDVFVNVIRQGSHVLVAACDAELLGRTLKFGEVDFTIREEFYRGSLMDVDGAIDIVKTGTVANLVGATVVGSALEAGIVHPKAVLDISGVPHAHVMRI
jgi:hypothetical protein